MANESNIQKLLKDFAPLLAKALPEDRESSDVKDPLSESGFADAVSKLEETLSNSGENTLARLFWIEAQLAQESAPVTAVSASLDSIADKIAEQNELLFVASRCSLRAIERLVERDQTRLAVVISRRAMSWSQKLAESKNDWISPKEQNHFKELHLALLYQEVEKSSLRRSSGSYRTRLEAEAKELKQKLTTSKISDSSLEKEKKQRSRPISSKSILEGAHEPEEEALATVPTRSSSSKIMRLFLIAILIGSVMLLGLVTVRNLFPKLDTADLDQRLSMDSVRHSDPEIIIPPIKVDAKPDAPHESRPSTNRVFGTDGVSATDGDFGDVQARLEKMNEKHPKQNTDQIQSAKVESAEQFDRAVEAEREKRRVEQEKEYQANMPSLEPSRLERNRVERVGEGERLTKVEELRVDPSGRVYGPPSNTRVVGKSPVDGSAVRAEEVRQYPPGTYFKTIVPTEVYSSPSLLAHSLARLEGGAKVQVVARMGRWLELESTKGRKGYIYAQDATEVN